MWEMELPPGMNISEKWGKILCGIEAADTCYPVGGVPPQR